MRTKLSLAGVLLLLVVAGAFWYPAESVRLTEKDTLLVGDFANSTGDAVFDKLSERPYLSVWPSHPC